MAFKCSKCGRNLYNRRRLTCEFCGADLPATLRMSASQIAAIERLKAAEAKEHREFMEREILPNVHPDVFIL